ncbi:MAG: hypothetical protein JF606_24795 [Burkholderiales bacterium]|nr:hypothetical protein [Burkholderiales bacterium]
MIMNKLATSGGGVVLVFLPLPCRRRLPVERDGGLVEVDCTSLERADDLIRERVDIDLQAELERRPKADAGPISPNRGPAFARDIEGLPWLTDIGVSVLASNRMWA